MTLRLRNLRIDVVAEGEIHQANAQFADGLCVVWGDNTTGKSTLFRSILVALGMEAMLTTNQRDLPLSPAVTSQLVSDDGKTKSITTSEILLEVEIDGKSLTFQRAVVGSRSTDLVRVHKGPLLSSSMNSHDVEDYYVRRPGSAVRDLGFHSYLAKLLGWKLPMVPTFEGNPCPLYLQLLFPFLFVEQKRGWSSILPPLPTHFRVRDAYRRGASFLLRLRGPDLALRRSEIEAEGRKIQAEWMTITQRLQDVAGRVHGTVAHLPSEPQMKWPPEHPPRILVLSGEDWAPLEQQIASWQNDRDGLLAVEVPTVQKISANGDSELAELEQRLRRRETRLARLFATLEQAEEQLHLVSARVTALNGDLTKNQDALTLIRVGGEHLQAITQSECPVCHQRLQDTVLPLEASQSAMSLDLNIDFIKEQKSTYESLMEASRLERDRLDRRAAGLQSEIRELRERVRSLRTTLVSSNALPSAAAIRLRLELERNISDAKFVIEKMQSETSILGELAVAWVENRAALKALPSAKASAQDATKVQRWTLSLREQLIRYGFSSLDAGKIAFSADTLRPELEGFDLPSVISASDMVRMIWASLIGLLEIAADEEGRHPGLLVFDEPKQQSTRDLSFRELLRSASGAAARNQQIVLFTSEDRSRLEESLRGLPHSILCFEGRILRRPSAS